MKDVGPSRNLNKVFAALIAALGVLPLYMGLHSLTFLPVDEWGFPAVALLIAAAFLGWAVYVWRRPSLNAARITFRDGGLRLETKQIFRGEKVFEIDWANVAALVKFDGGYGSRALWFEFRDNRPKAMFAAAWTDTDTLEILSRFEASAKEAGYVLEKQPGFWKSIVRQCWDVREGP